MAGIATLKDNVKFFLTEATEDVTIALADKIGNIVSIGDIGGETEEIDTTTIDSLAKEYVTGFEDNGTIELTQNLTDTEYAKMNTYKTSGVELKWGLSVDDRSGDQILGLTGNGFIKSVKLTGISVGGLLQVVASLRLSGAISDGFNAPTA